MLCFPTTFYIYILHKTLEEKEGKNASCTMDLIENVFMVKKWDNDLLDDAGFGGFTYLLEPLWWVGLLTSELS